MTKASLQFPNKVDTQNRSQIIISKQEPNEETQMSKKCPKYELSLNNRLPNKVTMDVDPITKPLSKPP